MEAACLRHTAIPHTSRLFSDFVYNFDRVSAFYAHAPYGDSFAKVAHEMKYPDDRRAALVAALRAHNGDSPALDRLAQPGTVVVATGQQVGLFTGPAYTIYKALTAAKLARWLTDSGVPAVPVFWLATEDHDFAEANHCYVFDEHHNPVKLAVDGTETGQPVGARLIGEAPITQLRAALHGFPFADDVLAAVEQAYRPGARFGEAFEQLLKTLVPDLGLLFLDPLDPAIRRIAAPVLKQAVENGDALTQAVIERSAELEKAGYHAQVHIEPKTSLVFLLEGDRRVNLRRQNGSYVARDRRYSPEELAANAERLSPNALLRPVVQDYILPTVAYVGGPAELAYLAQSAVLYRELSHCTPVAVPRTGFTLLDARASKFMQRYGLKITDVLASENEVREKIAAKLIPENLMQRFEAVRNEMQASLNMLRRDVVKFDPTLAAAIEKGRSKMLYQLTKLQAKTSRETLRRDERASTEAQFLSNLIYPEKHLQERFYSILPFVAKHGPELIPSLYETLSLECPDHTVAVV